MADHGGKVCGRCPSGPRLPRSVEGLIDAMRALERGDLRPIDVWSRDQFPVLRDALEAWAGDANLADRLACRVMWEAHRAAQAGRKIVFELSWVATVTRRACARIRHDEHPIGGQLPADIEAAAAGDALDQMIRDEERQQVRRAITTLPPRCRFAMQLRYVHGLTEADTAALVERLFGIGLDGTRYLLKEGRDMVSITLAGGDPRQVFPRRYGPRT